MNTPNNFVLKKFTHEKLFVCENSHCEAMKPEDIIPNKYSLQQAYDEGWRFKKADLIGHEKASLYNKDLYLNKVFVELYCPVCSKIMGLKDEV